MRGCTIPSIGFGTYRLTGREGAASVRDALEMGYRHVDTAQDYGNEKAVGQAIRESGIARDEIFLASKIWHDSLHPQDLYDSYAKSLEALQTDYVDLLLVHWPAPDKAPLEETLGAFYELKLKGLVRWTGVSNFTPDLTRKALAKADIICNQVEYHPFLAQKGLLKLAGDFNFFLTAYCPIARGAVFDDDTLKSIGEKYNKNAAQVSLRWLIQQPNVVAIPRSSSHEHRLSNLDIFNFELTEDEMEAIAALDRGERLIDPEFAPDWK